MKTIMHIVYLALALFAFASFALSPVARAVSPPPDRGYPIGNTAEGDNALANAQSNAAYNTAIGFEALFNLTNGATNTAIGFKALFNNNSFENTATGYQALFSNTEGTENTATGLDSLLNNKTGNQNTATGYNALFSNTTRDGNTATGNQALVHNNADRNTATGLGVLYANTTGNHNTATGASALELNTTGRSNTATGLDSLLNNRSGNHNTANGLHSLSNNRSGNQNTANGTNALLLNKTGNGNTAEGCTALQNNTGSFNTAVGFSAGANLTTGRDNVDIQALGVAGESNTMRIGTVKQTNTYIAGISGVTVAGGVGVIIDSSGHLGTISSSARFKQAIKPMDNASEAILALKPVTFRYKKELDPDKIPQFGLIAEEVEKVNPGLVARDEEGKIMSARYEAVNAMLLNEFLKEHRKVEKLEATVAQQQKNFEAAVADLKEQIQKVSVQLAVSKAAPQTVLNNQ